MGMPNIPPLHTTQHSEGSNPFSLKPFPSDSRFLCFFCLHAVFCFLPPSFLVVWSLPDWSRRQRRGKKKEALLRPCQESQRTEEEEEWKAATLVPPPFNCDTTPPTPFNNEGCLLGPQPGERKRANKEASKNGLVEK